MTRNIIPVLTLSLSLSASPLCPSVSRTQTERNTSPPPDPRALASFHGNYLAPLEAMRPLRERYASSPQWRDQFFEALGTLESFVGDDETAIADFDRKGPPPARPPVPASDATALRGYRPKDARPAILALAATHRAVFINEAHHVPMDRAFTLSLLRGLYRRGYRYFAAETLDEKDRELGTRGYPTQKTGYYTAEPVFGDLIRTALGIGFHVVPYEYRAKLTPLSTTNPLADAQAREQGEALNLYERILKRDPKAKILVHAGYGHIFRRTMVADWPAGTLGAPVAANGVFVPMAVCFEHITGIVPLCIDQTNLMAHPDARYEQALYRSALRHGLVGDRPVVFENAHHQGYVPPAARGGFDLIVCHPPPRYRGGRPTWLRMGGLRRPVVLPQNLLRLGSAPLLVQAYLRGESPGLAVPVDQVEIRADNKPLPVLLLPAGRFLVRAVNGAETVLRQWPVTLPATHHRFARPKTQTPVLSRMSRRAGDTAALSGTPAQVEYSGSPSRDLGA